ncbi:MAG: ABC transporter ATP-binding protein [Candidatus Eiseniibacteriota bacterium]|nr:MAG: ABC transporter ATP-binding protein [Candidatus Eisenbacteria bacterium]
MELVLENVGFSYDRGLPTETKVLDSLSAVVRTGEFLSIVGRTGSGKTTLALIMAGLLKPTSGTVTIKGGAGQPTTGMTPATPRGESAQAGERVCAVNGVDVVRRADVVMVFQFPESQFFEEDVFREVAFGPSRLGVRGHELSRRVDSALRAVNLDPDAYSRLFTSELSEGEKRRVAIASALSCQPHFLILDEPAISLDWQASADLFRALAELKRKDTAVVVATHEVGTAASLSDTVAVIGQGRLLALGKLQAQDIYAHLGAKRSSDEP